MTKPKPKRPAREVSARITLLVTTAEADLLQAAAAKDRRDLAEWCLRAALEAARRRVGELPPAAPEARR